MDVSAPCRELIWTAVTYDTADTMLLAEGIEQLEQLKRVSGGLLGRDNLDGNTLVEVDADV